MAPKTDYQLYRRVLRLVQELHLRGYQRLRIAPGMSAPMAVCPVSLSDKKHWISVDVSHLVQDWLSATLPNHGLALVGVAPVRLNRRRVR